MVISTFEGIERPWRDHNFARGGHGDGVNLSKAIIESCNIYFYGLGVKTGIDLLSNYGSQFGLGAKPVLICPEKDPELCPTEPGKKAPMARVGLMATQLTPVSARDLCSLHRCNWRSCLHVLPAVAMCAPSAGQIHQWYRTTPRKRRRIST